APGAVPAFGPVESPIRTPLCSKEFVISSEVAAGESVKVNGTWKAQIIPGIDAPPGRVPFRVNVPYEQQNAPPSYPPDYHGPHGSWTPMFKGLTVEGAFEVVGEARTLVSPGEAIDGLLSDRTFASWLAESPASSWSGANLFLYSWKGKSEV